MNSPRETSLARLPRSGDKLVDWIFKQFVFFLRRETLHIKRKKRMGEYGWVRRDRQQIIIALNAALKHHHTRDEALSTLVHEMSHVIYWHTQERFIQQIERILMKRLTQEQKNYLKSFIPHHEVKSVEPL